MEAYRFHGKRFIVFSAGKKQCEWLSPYHMHSDTDDRWLQALMNEEINELVSVQQLQENINVKNLQRSITTQAYTDPMRTIQQVGRILRLPVDQISIANILAFESSFDTSWVDKALSDFKKENIFWQPMPSYLYWTNEKVNVID
jgi:hypothetical protein